MRKGPKRRDEALFELIWPEGMPERDRVAYDAMEPARRDLVLARLEAAWRAENGEPWEPLAAGVGLKRAAFFNLRKAWRTRSIVGVIPHEARDGRSVLLGEDAPLRRRARELLRRTDGRGRNVDLARRVVDAEERATDGGAVGEDGEGSDRDARIARLTKLQRAQRVVQFERRQLASDVAYLSRAFGYGIVIDLSAVNVVLVSEVRSLAVAAIVMEAASGLVLGARIGAAAGAAALELGAVLDARRFLEDRRADRDGPKRCDCDMKLPPDFAPADEDVVALASAARDLNLMSSSGYAFGSGVLQVSGTRIGRLYLHPRKALSLDVDEFIRSGRRVVELAPDRAIAVFRNEVARQNGPVLAALVEAGRIDGAGSSGGRIADVLEAAATLLARPRD